MEHEHTMKLVLDRQVTHRIRERRWKCTGCPKDVAKTDITPFTEKTGVLVYER